HAGTDRRRASAWKTVPPAPSAARGPRDPRASDPARPPHRVRGTTSPAGAPGGDAGRLEARARRLSARTHERTLRGLRACGRAEQNALRRKWTEPDRAAFEEHPAAAAVELERSEIEFLSGGA